MAALFNGIGIPVLEIHSRKSQSYRTKTSDTFRMAKKGILFSSDVTARGLDYPDVTCVIQFGMTSREQYIHRLGRTARAGKEGSGMLLCSPDESKYLKKELNDMPLEFIDPSIFISNSDSSDNIKINQMQSTLTEDAEDAWGAWLGYYNSQLKRLNWSTEDLLNESKKYARSLGMKDIPTLPKRTLVKMGLVKAVGFKSETDVPSKFSQVKYRHANDKGRDGRDRGRAEINSINQPKTASMNKKIDKIPKK